MRYWLYFMVREGIQALAKSPANWCLLFEFKLGWACSRRARISGAEN